MKVIDIVEKCNRICIPYICRWYLACKLSLTGKFLPVGSCINIIFRLNFDLLQLILNFAKLTKTFDRGNNAASSFAHFYLSYIPKVWSTSGYFKVLDVASENHAMDSILDSLKAEVVIIKKQVNWFALQINWLVSIWWQLWHLMRIRLGQVTLRINLQVPKLSKPQFRQMDSY